MHHLLLILLCLVPLSHADSFLDRLPLLGNAKQTVILSPDKAFGLEVSARDESTLIANFKVTPGYYLYRDKVRFAILSDSAKTEGVKITNVSMPKGEMKSDPNFGDMAVFHQSFQAAITLERNTDKAQDITLAASYQGCKENDLCYAPIDKQFSIMLPKATPATTARQIQASPQAAQSVARPDDSLLACCR